MLINLAQLSTSIDPENTDLRLDLLVKDILALNKQYIIIVEIVGNSRKYNES